MPVSPCQGKEYHKRPWARGGRLDVGRVPTCRDGLAPTNSYEHSANVGQIPICPRLLLNSRRADWNLPHVGTVFPVFRGCRVFDQLFYAPVRWITFDPFTKRGQMWHGQAAALSGIEHIEVIALHLLRVVVEVTSPEKASALFSKSNETNKGEAREPSGGLQNTSRVGIILQVDATGRNHT